MRIGRVCAFKITGLFASGSGALVAVAVAVAPHRRKKTRTVAGRMSHGATAGRKDRGRSRFSSGVAFAPGVCGRLCGFCLPSGLFTWPPPGTPSGMNRPEGPALQPGIRAQVFSRWAHGRSLLSPLCTTLGSSLNIRGDSGRGWPGWSEGLKARVKGTDSGVGYSMCPLMALLGLLPSSEHPYYADCSQKVLGQRFADARLKALACYAMWMTRQASRAYQPRGRGSASLLGRIVTVAFPTPLLSAQGMRAWLSPRSESLQNQEPAPLRKHTACAFGVRHRGCLTGKPYAFFNKPPPFAVGSTRGSHYARIVRPGRFARHCFKLSGTGNPCTR